MFRHFSFFNMRKKYKYITLYSFLLVGGMIFMSAVPLETKGLTAYQIVKEMFARSKQITSLKYTMKKQERFNGKMGMQLTAVKIQYNPLKVYMRQESPKAGQEVLFVEGKNNNQILVNTNGFPWVNISLDPMGNTARENQHHTLFESGYAHLISILEHLTTKYQKDIESMITIGGSVNWNGRACWIIEFNNPNFKYYDYTVKSGENILTIATKAKLSEYMILEMNKKKVSSYTNVPVGTVLTIPNDYSPKMELYIDKINYAPLVMKIYDDKGIYEYYEYYNVVINPTFQSNEFDKTFPDYDF
jgi:outer membrane lipoprotein-sorting protein